MPLTPLNVGQSVLKALQNLSLQDLRTQCVEEAYQVVLQCVKAVDADVRLYMFGSTAVYGIHEKGSDVDFVALSRMDVEHGRREDAATQVAKALQIDFLGKTAKVMRQKHPYWSVDEVRRTRVPVIRVKGGNSVDFDITVGRRNGVRNSALLRAYFEQRPASRYLSLALKRWSKSAGLNASVPGGSITSYGFNIMAVYYLLRREKVQFVAPESIDVASVLPVPPYLPLESYSQNDGGEEFGREILDFLDFYQFEFDATRHVISLSRPGITSREQLGWTKDADDAARMKNEKVSYQWCIEDPYELNLNVGRNVTPLKLDFLRKHMVKARETALLTIV